MVRLGSLLTIAALLVLPAACGGDGESDLCESLGDIQTSAQELRDIEPGEDAVDQLQAVADDLRDELDAVEEAAGDEVRPEVADLRSAAEELEDEVEAAAEGGLTGEELQAVATAGSSVVTAFGALREAAPDCDL
jgi:predicted nuclease with TOPRIM domain